MNDFIYKEGKIKGTKHKYFDLQIGLFDNDEITDYFDFKLQWSKRIDHAGFNFHILD